MSDTTQDGLEKWHRFVNEFEVMVRPANALQALGAVMAQQLTSYE